MWQRVQKRGTYVLVEVLTAVSGASAVPAPGRWARRRLQHANATDESVHGQWGLSCPSHYTTLQLKLRLGTMEDVMRNSVHNKCPSTCNAYSVEMSVRKNYAKVYYLREGFQSVCTDSYNDDNQ